MKEVKRYDIYMHSDDVQFLRECPEGDYVRFGDFDSIVKELEGKLKVTVEAFTSLSRGWYFDEDGIVQPVEDPGAFAEGALAQIEGK